MPDLDLEADVFEVEVIEGEVVEDVPEADMAIALFGEGAKTDYTPTMPMPSRMDIKREWAQCFDQWLADSANSPKTERAYLRAWEDLLDFVDSLPSHTEDVDVYRVSEYWQITHRHIRAWIKSLETRPLDPRRRATLKRRGRDRACGYAASTINQYLAAISSFFSYAERNWPVMLPNGQEIALTTLCGIQLNPVKVIKRKTSGAVKRREQPYMSIEQLRRFLNAIPVDSPTGLRDRALFTFYVMTGARNTEARTLRWGDIEERGGRMQWYWRGKGRGRKANKQAWKDLPPECWDRIRQYLKAVGRWSSMDEEDYLFTAVSDSAANLPTVSEDAWSPFSQPLSSREVNRRVKLYAERAGLDPEEIHVHTLRHSAAMLMKEAGADVSDIMHFLNHENLNTTQLYLHRMEGQRNVHAGKMAELLRL